MLGCCKESTRSWDPERITLDPGDPIRIALDLGSYKVYIYI